MLPASIRVRHIAEASSRLVMGRRLRITERVSPQTLVPPHGSVKGKTWARGNDGREGDRRAAGSCGGQTGLGGGGGRRGENAGGPVPPPRPFSSTPPLAPPTRQRSLCGTLAVHEPVYH